MKFLLFNSPIYEKKSEVEEEYLPPLGLGYIATHLNNAGICTKFFDSVKKRLGIDEILDLVNKYNPDYFGINIFTLNFEIVKKIIESLPSHITAIIGGQVVGSVYLDILNWKPSCKIIAIIGESELILPKIILGECSELPFQSVGENRAYRVDSQSAYYPHNLDSVILDRKIFDEEMLINHYGLNEAAIVTSRGCIYNCAFCGGATSLHHGISPRYHSVDNVISEIKGIFGMQSNIQCIRVLDDLFLRDENSIINAIRIFSSFPDLSWRGMAHIITFDKSIELLADLKRSGCRELSIGIESGSERIRRKIHKPGDYKIIKKVIDAILEVGIDVKAYFMFGFPTETVQDAEQTEKLAKELHLLSASKPGKFRTSVFQFRPYHGTELYKEIKANGREIGLLIPNDAIRIRGRSQFSFQSGNYSEMTDDELHTIIMRTQTLWEDTK